MLIIFAPLNVLITSMLLIGPPGTGKSMLAKRLMSILPDLSELEMIDINIISSITGGTFKTSRPFREPHHSCSMPAMQMWLSQ